MAVKIRLEGFGKIWLASTTALLSPTRTQRDGRAIEEIGKYHPKNDPSVIEVDSDRAQYWLSVGAQPTEAVVALFKRTGDWGRSSPGTPRRLGCSRSRRSPTRPTPSTPHLPKPARPKAAPAISKAASKPGEHPDRSGQGRGTPEEAPAGRRRGGC